MGSELAGQKQALKATINRQKAEKDNAVVDLKRYDDIFKQEAISAQELDAKRLKAETSTEQVVGSKADRFYIVLKRYYEPYYKFNNYLVSQNF